MDKEQLVKWMEQHGVGQLLKSWVNNHLLGHGNYEVLQDLVTKNAATIQVSLSPSGTLNVNSVEPVDVDKFAREIESLKETVKEQAEEIKSLKKEKTEEVVAEEAMTPEEVGVGIVEAHADYVKSEKKKPKRRRKKT